MPTFLLPAYQPTIFFTFSCFSINVCAFSEVVQCLIALMYFTGAIAHVYELKKCIAAQPETHSWKTPAKILSMTESRTLKYPQKMTNVNFKSILMGASLYEMIAFIFFSWESRYV